MSRHRDDVATAFGRHSRGAEPVTTPTTYYTVLGPAIELLHAQPESFMRDFYATVFAHDFQLRKRFPTFTDRRTVRYARGLIYFLETIDQATPHPEQLDGVMEFLSQLGRDQRKHQFTDADYHIMAIALRDTFARLMPFQWSADLDAALLSSFEHAIDVMQTAASAETTPPVYLGNVMEVQRLTRDIAVIRLQTDPPIDYLPGQYMSVQIPQCPGTWRYLSATIPANPDGYLEFHVRALEHGYFSTQVVQTSRPGDQWILSNPHGNLQVSGERPVCMIARNVALAPMRCILLDLVQTGKNNPLVDVYYGTRYPGELFDAATLANIQAANPWLIAHICAEKDSDPWWLRDAPPLPPNLLLRRGNPLELAVADGCVHDREILVGGGPQIVQQAVANLPRLGINLADIHHDPLD